MKRAIVGISIALLWSAAVLCTKVSMSQDQSSQPQEQGTGAEQNQPVPEQTAPVTPPQNQLAPPSQPQVPADTASPEKQKVTSAKKSTTKSGAGKSGSKSMTAAKKSNAKKVPAAGQSGKVVVRNGGTKDTSVQLAPGMTKEQQQHSRETEQLLATTDTNLKSLAGRQLTPSQQNMLDQIHAYVRQSKEAAGSGDLDRAHTLAYKAHLLSDELATK